MEFDFYSSAEEDEQTNDKRKRIPPSAASSSYFHFGSAEGKEAAKKTRWTLSEKESQVTDRKQCQNTRKSRYRVKSVEVICASSKISVDSQVSVLWPDSRSGTGEGFEGTVIRRGEEQESVFKSGEWFRGTVTDHRKTIEVYVKYDDDGQEEWVPLEWKRVRITTDGESDDVDAGNEDDTIPDNARAFDAGVGRSVDTLAASLPPRSRSRGAYRNQNCTGKKLSSRKCPANGMVGYVMPPLVVE